MTRTIGLVTDFGVADPYAGQMEAAIAAIAPSAQVIHLCHGIPPQNVALGAVVITASAPLLPPGGIIVGVVDPGVGTARRGIIVRAGGRWLVGPDNGLLLAGDAPDGVWGLDQPAYWRPHPSPTFHGRDVFGPVAAHLAAYVRPEAMGSPLDDPVAAPAAQATADAQGVRGTVIHVDRFGNLITNLSAQAVTALGEDLTVAVGDQVVQGLARTYGPGRELVALIGSWDLLEIALPGGSAADRLGVSAGAVVTAQRAT